MKRHPSHTPFRAFTLADAANAALPSKASVSWWLTAKRERFTERAEIEVPRMLRHRMSRQVSSFEILDWPV